MATNNFGLPSGSKSVFETNPATRAMKDRCADHMAAEVPDRNIRRPIANVLLRTKCQKRACTPTHRSKTF